MYILFIYWLIYTKKSGNLDFVLDVSRFFRGSRHGLRRNQEVSLDNVVETWQPSQPHNFIIIIIIITIINRIWWKRGFMERVGWLTTHFGARISFFMNLSTKDGWPLENLIMSSHQGSTMFIILHLITYKISSHATWYAPINWVYILGFLSFRRHNFKIYKSRFRKMFPMLWQNWNLLNRTFLLT